jgi:hypothetical protein
VARRVLNANRSPILPGRIEGSAAREDKAEYQNFTRKSRGKIASGARCRMSIMFRRCPGAVTLAHISRRRRTTADAAKSVLLTEDVHRARPAAHRKLMQVYYDGAFQNKSKIFAGVVLDHDQRTRMTWFWWSAGIFLVSASLVSLNATSWHGYYATRLAILEASAQSGTVAIKLKSKILPKEGEPVRNRKKKANGNSSNNVRRKRPR